MNALLVRTTHRLAVVVSSVSGCAMGIVNLGVPEKIVLELARLNHSTVFIETGTFEGTTAKWASNHFETVHTIERSHKLFDACRRELAATPGVTPHLGDSRDVLPQLLERIGERKAVWWLDGHFSGGETAGKNDECPLLDELACLSERTNDIIVIDDARLFMCAPPLPHNPSHWPTIAEIMARLPASGEPPIVQIVDDVIFNIPNESALKNHLVNYAQSRSQMFWREFKRLQRGKRSFTRSVKRRLKKVFRARAG